MTSPLKKWKTTLWAPLQHTVLVQDWTTSSTAAIFRTLLERLILSTGAIQTLTSVSGWNKGYESGLSTYSPPTKQHTIQKQRIRI